MKDVPSSRYFLFAAVAATGCLADLGTKYLVFKRLGMPGDGQTLWLCGQVFGLQTSLNRGALFGIGQGAVWLFASLSVVAAAGIVYWLFVARAASDRLLTLALAGITGGILGNLYDRLGLWSAPGHPDQRFCAVRDWILFQIPDVFTWPNFNLADSLLVCGAALLVWHAWFDEKPKSVET